MRASLVALLLGCVGLCAPAGAQTFDQYKAGPLYTGPPHFPDFNGRDRAFRAMRTRLREGVRSGVNFGGKYAVVEWGCGTQCTNAAVVDLSTGRVYKFDTGGVTRKFRRDSLLVVSSDHSMTDNECTITRHVFKNNALVQLSEKKLTLDLDDCFRL